MNAGPKYEYLWQDNDKYKTPTRLSAPKYIEILMDVSRLAPPWASSFHSETHLTLFILQFGYNCLLLCPYLIWCSCESQWVDRQLSDEAIFPTHPGSKVPANFLYVKPFNSLCFSPHSSLPVPSSTFACSFYSPLPVPSIYLYLSSLVFYQFNASIGFFFHLLLSSRNKMTAFPHLVRHSSLR